MKSNKYTFPLKRFIHSLLRFHSIPVKRSLNLLISNKYDPAFEWVDVDADVIRLDDVQISAWRFELDLSQVRPQLNILVTKKNGGRPQV